MLDEIVLDAGIVGLRENAFEVDAAIPHFSHLAVLLHVLDMDEWKASRITVEVGQRILSCLCDPEQIHFHLDEVRIGFIEQ